MDSYKYLIIGGGVAGTTAAETLRQKDRDGSIAIVSDEPRMYSRIMLSKPNFFLGKIPFDSVWLREEKWYTENKIDFIGNVLAKKLNSADKTIELSDGKILKYEKLLLATGGEAGRWNIPGADKKGICYLRDLREAEELIKNVKSAKHAIAIGSGFVSFEMCEMMRLAGLEVTLVMREPYYWYPLLDEESGKMIGVAMEKGGVKILRESEVSEIIGNENIEGVILKDGTQIPCQLALIGIGLECHLDWIKEAGVETGRGILANEYLETNIPDIYAAGDVAEFNDLVLGERVQLGNWVNAQTQGRTVAKNMMGNHEPFKMVSFYSSIGFGLNIAVSGDACSKPTCNVIRRGSPESGSFARIIVDKDNEIIGATFINRTQDLQPINKLIELDFKVVGHESELSDPNFELKSLF
ncbi:MAG: FAD-dependent oxidoreductase [Candidatus Zambryskibacteria bacterium]